MNASEAARRRGKNHRLRTFFAEHPKQWIGAVDLEPIAGRQAWRTRVSELRRMLLAENAGTIQNRVQYTKRMVVSEYMFLPYVPLGPDPSEYRAQELPLFASDPSGWRE